MRLLIGIPCFNEEKSIDSVLKSLPKKLLSISSIEVLVVDDGSSDLTAAIARNNNVHVVEHTFNKGLGVAFRTMLEWSLHNRMDILVTMDGDGQFDVNNIQSLIDPILSDKADFVTASRFLDKAYLPDGIPLVKLWGNKRMASLISRLTDKKVSDAACGFRAYSKNCLLNLNLYGKFTYTQETFLDLSFKGFRITEVPARVKYFNGRKSRMASNIPKYALNTLKIIMRVYRDYYPLRFFWSISLVCILLSTGLGFLFFAHFLQTGQFYGHLWAGLSSAFFAGIGIFLFILGLVVDMLDRIRLNQERVLALLKSQLYS
jgi:glycosyltransferase involved in cell wall biosynthesis